MKKFILIMAMSSLISATHAQVAPTTFEKVSDSLWYVTEPMYGGGMVTREAYPVSNAIVTADINNRVRSAACFYTGGLICTTASLASSLAYARTKENVYNTASAITGVAAVCLYSVVLFKLFPDRVVATPDGVILRLGKKK